jgi:putative transposase
MANTFSQIYIQAVFVVQDRESLIQKEWRDDMEKYRAGIVQKRGNKLIKIGGMPDHVHLFFGMKPNENVADVMKWVKGSSSEWINDSKFSPHKFQWQSGYGAFSYAHSQMDAVVKYIENQEEHHKKMTFREEYLAFLKAFDVPYDERYIFHDVL